MHLCNKTRLFDKVNLICKRIILKNGKVGLENATLIQIQDMFENGKPGIVLKTVKGFNTKHSFYNFDLRK